MTSEPPEPLLLTRFGSGVRFLTLVVILASGGCRMEVCVTTHAADEVSELRKRRDGIVEQMYRLSAVAVVPEADCTGVEEGAGIRRRVVMACVGT